MRPAKPVGELLWRLLGLQCLVFYAWTHNVFWTVAFVVILVSYFVEDTFAHHKRHEDSTP